ncbi:hypothetical protein PMAYCL1PPCAC_01843, partial [Pristionchus mayeri]
MLARIVACFSMFLTSNIAAHSCFFDRLPDNVNKDRLEGKMVECSKGVKECVTIHTSVQNDDDWEVYVERRCPRSQYECAGQHNECKEIDADPVWGKLKKERRCCHNDPVDNQSTSVA